MTKRGRKTVATPDLLERWIELFRQGKTWVEIASLDPDGPIGETIRLAVKGALGEAELQRKAPTPEDIERWVWLYNKGLGYSHIANFENNRFAYGTIRNYIKDRVEHRDRVWYKSKEAIELRRAILGRKRYGNES